MNAERENPDAHHRSQNRPPHGPLDEQPLLQAEPRRFRSAAFIEVLSEFVRVARLFVDRGKKIITHVRTLINMFPARRAADPAHPLCAVVRLTVRRAPRALMFDLQMAIRERDPCDNEFRRPGEVQWQKKRHANV